MEKPNIYQIVGAIALALATYFARYEFENIKLQQRDDKATVQQLTDKVNTVDKNVAILLERTPVKVNNWQQSPSR